MSLENQILEISSQEFVSFSFGSPLLEFYDKINQIKWEYRQGGPKDSSEAVILIPTIYENTNSMFLIATGLISKGYRVLILSIPESEKIDPILVGFDQITAFLHISSIHLIGIGFGGFLSMFITSFKTLSAEIKSLILISSFTETTLFKSPNGLFSSLVIRGDLLSELSPNLIPNNLKDSINFISKEIENIPKSILLARSKCRNSKLKCPLPTFNDERVLIIQPIDWAYKLEQTAKPHKVIQGSKTIMTQLGGLLPHLVIPDIILNHLYEHLLKWYKKND